MSLVYNVLACNCVSDEPENHLTSLTVKESTDKALAPHRSLKPRTLYYWLARLSCNTPASILTISALAFICYYNSLGGYFLADDLIHIPYLYKVFHGQWHLLLENFYSNWLQTEGTRFYRPVISLTLAWDYLFWGVNAFGYHLSNLLFHIATSIGLFLATRRLFILDLRASDSIDTAKASSANQAGDENRQAKKPSRYRRLLPDHFYSINLVALIAACLFSAHPLHCEVVSWVLGRVDSVCASFYMFSLWLFLVSLTSPGKQLIRYSRYGSIALFALALGSKEMAVTLPPVLVLLLVLFREPLGSGVGKTLFHNLVHAFKVTWQLWLVLALYFVIRYLALGTVAGGYQGSIGEGLATTLLKRILSTQTLHQILYPLNHEVFTRPGRWIDCLRVTYGWAIISFVFTLLITRSRSTMIKAVTFAGGWFALVMLPTIPVFNLTESLQSSRYIYMGTAPLSVLLALMICPLARHGTRYKKERRKTNVSLRVSQQGLKGLTTILSISTVCLYALITTINDTVWAHASKETSALQSSLVKEISSIPPEQKLALLNLPQSYKGAHMIYNGAMMSVLMAPPLTSSKEGDRLITFEPAMFGYHDLVRPSRLRRIADDRDGYSLYYWQRSNLELVRLDLDGSPAGTRHIDTHDMELPHNKLLVLPALDVPSLGWDLMQIDMTISRKHEGVDHAELVPLHVPVFVDWTSSSQPRFSKTNQLVLPGEADGKRRTLGLSVSEHKKWVASTTIHRIGLSSLVAPYNIVVHGVKLSDGRSQIPLLSTTQPESGLGILNVPPEQETIFVSYNASSVKNAKSAVIELSRPNSWFNHYTGTYRDSSLCDKALHRWSEKELVARNLALNLKMVDQSGFYEIRLAALDEAGEVAGYFSDPLVLQVTR